MLYKHAIITALVVFILIPLIALGILVLRHDLSGKHLVEYTWLVSVPCSIIGFYLRGGAAARTTVEGFEAVSYAAPNKENHREADNDDAAVGMAFGTVVMLSSLAVFAIALTTLKLID